MKKELEENLRNMQANPTTGTAHNHQLITTQVETIFSVDELSNEIKKLRIALEESGRQSLRLEISNYRLQWVMLILTAVATMVVVYPIANSVIKWLSPQIEIFFNHSISLSMISLLAGIISGFIAAGFIKIERRHYEKSFKDVIKIRDSMEAVLRDKDGNIKEIRKSE